MFGGDNKEETRNLILAAVLSMLVVFAWSAFFAPPPPPPPSAVEETAGTGASDAPVVGADGTAADAPQVAQSRDGALATTGRVEVRNDAVYGSISLRGGRLDDLHLSEYRETIEPESDTVVLLNPTGGPNPYFAVYGWLRTADGETGPLPGPSTEWELEKGDVLTPESPITLRWDNGEGLIFRREIAIDDRYMFSVTQSVENTTDAAVSLAPYGYIARRGMPETIQFFILHEGVVASFDGQLQEVSYDDMLELPPSPLEGGLAQATPVTGDGWLGFTDKYWMTTLIPDPGQAFTAVYRTTPGPQPEFRTEMRLPVITVAPGATDSAHTEFFAGAKEVATIQRYQEAQGIVQFEDAIDWGWFYFLTKPMFWLLSSVQSVVGNMGFSIIVLTLIVKAILFPLAHKSYVAMSKMKKLQPEMEKIKERAGDDKMKLQKEMMDLYKKEKVNPASGCLPILVQIPIFFALYKVLFVTIEVRHAPFIGWIEDLSAPDPTSWLNLFGLLPYDVSWAPVFISIGVLPILMGISMWAQQKLNPAPTDPTQQMIFAWMPWLFMFMLGSFASGLVIYWIANNVLTFTQQYIIMRSQGVEVDFFGNVKQSFRRKPVTAAATDTKAEKKPAPEIEAETDTGAETDTDGADGTPEDKSDTAGETGTPANQPRKRKGPQRNRRKR